MSFLSNILGKNVSRCYTSPITQFLTECDQKRAQPSNSQRSEINKFNKIAYLRDHALKAKQKDLLI
jgi:hypothetical protein